MRYRFMRYPGGKKKAVTLSYDDGVRADKRLAELLTANEMKGTFNVNTGMWQGEGKLSPDELQKYILDAGHEIAVHGHRHIAPGAGIPAVVVGDVLDCRRALEEAFGCIIRGMAYPDSGVTKMHNENTYPEIRSLLQSLGIVYARSLAGDNDKFMLPTDFLCWVPTAHHNNPHLFEWVEKFNAIEEGGYAAAAYPRLFYLWGHSYEFDKDDNWHVIERFCREIGGREDTWYPTNIELYEYAQAYNSLVCSADGNRIYNPTLHTVWISTDGKSTWAIAPGETLVIY
ncbi:MAG: polysaccharide deacetylase family protein [Clostridia bacterium]|nr:polysaccharide deacetylase family protein [Clostridia bacterium]